MRLATLFDPISGKAQAVFVLPGGERVDLTDVVHYAPQGATFDNFANLAEVASHLDVVLPAISGWRSVRRDTWLTRQLPSHVANWLLSKLCGVDLHDFGTTFKAYRRESIKDLQLYGDSHRFIPALSSWSGASIAEIPIKNVNRQNGKSNYGISRTITVFLDLICLKFLLD